MNSTTEFISKPHFAGPLSDFGGEALLSGQGLDLACHHIIVMQKVSAAYWFGLVVPHILKPEND